jgi:hypothetical protein
MSEQQPKKIYEDLGNGIIAYDAESANKPMADFAKKMYYSFLITGIIVFFLIMIFWVIPWGLHAACHAPMVNPDIVLCQRWKQ